MERWSREEVAVGIGWDGRLADAWKCFLQCLMLHLSRKNGRDVGVQLMYKGRVSRSMFGMVHSTLLPPIPDCTIVYCQKNLSPFSSPSHPCPWDVILYFSVCANDVQMI